MPACTKTLSRQLDICEIAVTQHEFRTSEQLQIARYVSLNWSKIMRSVGAVGCLDRKRRSAGVGSNLMVVLELWRLKLDAWVIYGGLLWRQQAMMSDACFVSQGCF